MPFIHTMTNLPLSRQTEEKLRAAYGEAAELIGKSENWLMLRFEDGCRLWMAGGEEPAAMVQVDLYGKAAAAQYEAMTARLTAALEQELGLAPERVYVRYAETPNWGWSGSNF